MVQAVLKTVRICILTGVTCVLAEQNMAVSLKLASHACVAKNGRITLPNSGKELLRVRQAYLGL